MKRDYLYSTPYTILQKENMYHFNSDSELLGRFCRIEKEDTVLDIGTNNGVLLHYASLHEPRAMCGIDLFPEVIETARENLAYNHLEAELQVTPLQEFEHEPFSCILCNPPFFTTQREDLKSENPYRRAARFTDTLSIHDLFLHAARLSCQTGRLSVIYPHSLMQEVLETASSNQFFLTRLQAVYDQKGGEVRRCLMEFSKEKKDTLEVMPIAWLNRLHESRSRHRHTG